MASDLTPPKGPDKAKGPRLKRWDSGEAEKIERPRTAKEVPKEDLEALEEIEEADAEKEGRGGEAEDVKSKMGPEEAGAVQEVEGEGGKGRKEKGGDDDEDEGAGKDERADDDEGVEGDGEEKRPDRITRLKREAGSFALDFVGALIVLLIIIGGLYTYTDNWPPLVVVQSGSMQHSDDRSYVGVIDTGDLVFVKNTGDDGRLITYAEGMNRDYRTYDSFGDVIIYRPNGETDRTAIIHRAVVYIEFNATTYNNVTKTGGSFDVPSLGLYGQRNKVQISGYEWPRDIREQGLYIDLEKILLNFRTYDTPPHGGYITKGDDNPGVDQTSDFFSNDPPWIEPVRREWVVGRSVGELPWFGIIKLYLEKNKDWPANSLRNLIIALVVLLTTPFLVDLTFHAFRKATDTGKGDEEEEERSSGFFWRRERIGKERGREVRARDRRRKRKQ